MDVLREKIKLPDSMMRETVSEKSLEDLVKSIRKVGLINPLVVRKVGDGYELIAGLRRLMAADVLKMEKVMVRVIRVGDEKAERIKMDENREREDVNPIEEGVFLKGMLERFGWKQKQLAEHFSVSESYISQRLGAVDWPKRLSEVVKNGQVTFSVAREFAQIRHMGEMERVIDQAIRGGVSPAVAARWRHEINREVVKTEAGQIEGGGYPGGGPWPDVLYGCEICGKNVKEAQRKIMWACDVCQEVIKVGQEKGVFRKEEEQGVPSLGEGVE